MNCDRRINELERKLGEGAPEVLIVASDEQAQDQLREFPQRWPNAPDPLIVRPDPTIRKR